MEQREIILDGNLIIYWLRVSARARRVSLVMGHDGRFVAVLPIKKKERLVEEFMYDKKKWIHKTLSNYKKKRTFLLTIKERDIKNIKTSRLL